MAETKTLPEIYDAFKPYADAITTTKLNTSDFFSHTLAAAFAKAYEFNVSLRNEDRSEDPFFSTATLRGICEDIIGLKFFAGFSASDRQEILANIMMLSLFDSMTKQGKFFSHYRPSQPVLPGYGKQQSAEARLAELIADNAALKKKHGWPAFQYQYLPSVRSMATQSGLLDLYDYMYGVTSKWVHFSPGTLLRMGWGPSTKEGKCEMKDGAPLTFTTRNFRPYYKMFNEFYGTFLFLTFNDQLKAELNFPIEATPHIEDLRNYIKYTLRWPEDVTFEELNLKGPSDIIRVLLHSQEAISQRETPPS